MDMIPGAHEMDECFTFDRWAAENTQELHWVVTTASRPARLCGLSTSSLLQSAIGPEHADKTALALHNRDRAARDALRGSIGLHLPT